MAWQLTDDVEAYLAAAGGFLRANAVWNTIMLGVAGALQVRGPAAFGDAAPLCGWWTEPDGAVSAALLQTPPYPMLLTVLPPGAAAALAAELAGRGHHPSAVNAAPESAAEFAAAWKERTGRAAVDPGATAGQARTAASACRHERPGRSVLSTRQRTPRRTRVRR